MARNYILQLQAILRTGPLTQEALAKRLGVTFAALSRWLHGQATPRPRHVEAIRRLHQELVGFPSFDDDQVLQLVRRAEALRQPDIRRLLTKHQPLQDELLLEHTYNSTSIEGTTLSRRETEVVIFDRGTVPEKSLVEHLEVTNYATVLRDVLLGRYREPIAEELIRTLHRHLLQGIHPEAGQYSKHHRVIRGVEIALTHPKDIPEEVGELLAAWGGKPVKKTLREIASFHVQFELIHPFGDGNGRLGRILMALQCLERGYPPIVIETARKADYYETLEYAQKRSIGPFLAFLVEELERTRRLVRKYR